MESLFLDITWWDSDKLFLKSLATQISNFFSKKVITRLLATYIQNTYYAYHIYVQIFKGRPAVPHSSVCTLL